MPAAKKAKPPAKKPVTPSKAKPSAKKAAPEKNVLQKVEDAVGGAGKAIGAAYDKSQEARRGIWKNVKRSPANKDDS